MDLNAILEEEKKLRKPGPKPLRKTRQLSELLMPLVPKAIKALSNALSDPDKDVSAAKEVLDRVYGKAPQAVDLKASGEILISVNVTQRQIGDSTGNQPKLGIMAETITGL